MKGFPQFCFLLLLSLSAFALDEGHARYVGGSGGARRPPNL